jgi:hypothetical protein
MWTFDRNRRREKTAMRLTLKDRIVKTGILLTPLAVIVAAAAPRFSF